MIRYQQLDTSALLQEFTRNEWMHLKTRWAQADDCTDKRKKVKSGSRFVLERGQYSLQIGRIFLPYFLKERGLRYWLRWEIHEVSHHHSSAFLIFSLFSLIRSYVEHAVGNFLALSNFTIISWVNHFLFLAENIPHCLLCATQGRS